MASGFSKNSSAAARLSSRTPFLILGWTRWGVALPGWGRPCPRADPAPRGRLRRRPPPAGGGTSQAAPHAAAPRAGAEPPRATRGPAGPQVRASPRRLRGAGPGLSPGSRHCPHHGLRKRGCFSLPWPRCPLRDLRSSPVFCIKIALRGGSRGSEGRCGPDL